MALWDEVRQAAEDAHAERGQLRQHLRGLWLQVTGRVRHLSTRGEPPVVTLDLRSGRAAIDGETSALAVLKRSMLLAAAGALLAGLTWLGVFFLAMWLFLQRVAGLGSPAAAPAAA
jgi:hypothetical protein